MSKIAIAFLCKDRVELSKRTIEPLLKAPVDIFIIDGSTTDEGKKFPEQVYTPNRFYDVRGGPDAAVAFALGIMLSDTKSYDYVGLCENDVLLPSDWFDQTFALFHQPAWGADAVGAVSSRAYVDRVLFQRSGYALMHNLGWGHQILTRKAAHLSLYNMRTSYSLENRRVFAKLAYVDIGKWWAFRNTETHLCADWGNDRILASHGLASLALVPSPVQMIGQNPPLAAQNLQLAEMPVELLRNDNQCKLYLDNLTAIRNGAWSLNDPWEFHDISNGTWTYFAHQVPSLGGTYKGDWKLRFLQGFGPFAWEARSTENVFPSLDVAMIGTCDFICSGGEKGGQVRVRDHTTDYECSPSLAPETVNPQVTNVTVPSGMSYRQMTFEALTPGVTFYGIRAREPQPIFTNVKFTHVTLPPV